MFNNIFYPFNHKDNDDATYCQRVPLSVVFELLRLLAKNPDQKVEPYGLVQLIASPLQQDCQEGMRPQMKGKLVKVK